MPNDDGNGGIDFDKTHFFDNEENLLYIASDGPAANNEYCPWNAATWWDWGSYRGDCWIKSKCYLNLKYFGRCNNEMFDSVFGSQVCKWQEALEILPMINREINILGRRWEESTDRECHDKKVPINYLKQLDFTSSLDFESMNVVRDVKSCQIDAGAIPCNLMKFHNLRSPNDLIFRLKKIVKHIGRKCNMEWIRHVTSLVQRLENAVNCPGNNHDHNPALLIGMTRSDGEIIADFDSELASDEELDAFYEENYA
jgi:hypothetical protein